MSQSLFILISNTTKCHKNYLAGLTELKYLGCRESILLLKCNIKSFRNSETIFLGDYISGKFLNSFFDFLTTQKLFLLVPKKEGGVKGSLTNVILFLKLPFVEIRDLKEIHLE